MVVVAMSGRKTGIVEQVRQHLRRWLLSEEERELVARVDENESGVDEVRSEWSELQRAFEHAEIVGEHELDSADILVLTGRQHLVQGAGFDGPIYINGSEHRISNNHIQEGER